MCQKGFGWLCAKIVPFWQWDMKNATRWVRVAWCMGWLVYQ